MGVSAEHGAKGFVEGGEVAKAGIERNGDDRAAGRGERERGAAQPGADKIAMRRHAREPAEDAQEVILAHARGGRHLPQLKRSACVGFDQSDRVDDPSRLAPGGRGLSVSIAGHRRDHALDDPQRQFIRAQRRRGARQRLHVRDDWQRFRRRRQARGRKAKTAGRGRGCGDLAELLLVHVQGNAAIANPMRVTAFET